MDKNKLIFTNLLFVVLLTGCGSKSPKDVSTEFIKSLSDTNIKKAKSISSKRVNKSLDKLIMLCNKNTINDLYAETKTILELIEKKKYKIDNIMNGSEEERRKVQEIVKIAEKKFTDNSLGKTQDELKTEFLITLTNVMRPKIDEIFDLLNIKTKHLETVKSIVTEFNIKGSGYKLTYRNKGLLNTIVEKAVSINPSKITSKCVYKYTKFGLVDDINFIETKKPSPDKATVRLEIIYQDGTSSKILLHIEQIREEWKVARFYI